MRPAILILPILMLLGGCDAENGRLPGYVEGEYVRVAAPSGGRLQALPVREGDRLTAGALLFTLESDPEQAAVQAASARLQQSQAQLADLDKGQRRDELAVLEAQLAATRASEALAHRDLLRQQQLARQGVVSVATLDSYRARWQLEQGNRQALDAQLRVARLAARDDQRQAARSPPRKPSWISNAGNCSRNNNAASKVPRWSRSSTAQANGSRPELRYSACCRSAASRHASIYRKPAARNCRLAKRSPCIAMAANSRSRPGSAISPIRSNLPRR